VHAFIYTPSGADAKACHCTLFVYVIHSNVFCSCLGYLWKLKKVYQALVAVRHEYNLVLLADALDSCVSCTKSEPAEKFMSFRHDMVVSRGEAVAQP
jgi:hypothetical protein